MKSNSGMNRFSFFVEGVKNIKTVGAIFKTSKYASEAMLKPIDFNEARIIIELGAGDGSITKHILKKMHNDARLYSFELNENFAQKLNSRFANDSRLKVIHDSAEHLSKYIQQHKLAGKIDAIVSAIPFVVLPDELGDFIVSEASKHLKASAPFTQIHYSLIAKKMYQKHFKNVEVEWVPANIPPAYILTCKNL